MTDSYTAYKTSYWNYALPLAFGWLLIPLIYVWWERMGTTLKVYKDGRIILEKGVLNKDSQEIMSAHIRSIRIKQSLMERILNIGTLIISTAGRASDFDEELVMKGIERPNYTRDSILATKS